MGNYNLEYITYNLSIEINENTGEMIFTLKVQILWTRTNISQMIKLFVKI